MTVSQRLSASETFFFIFYQLSYVADIHNLESQSSVSLLKPFLIYQLVWKAETYVWDSKNSTLSFSWL